MTRVRRRSFLRSIDESVLYAPNLIVLCVVLAYVIPAWFSVRGAESLVSADSQTVAQIAELERQLADQPVDPVAAIDLALLYKKTHAYPWAREALRLAEQNSPADPRWKLRIGLAYLEIGRNVDGLRVLRDARMRCKGTSCPADTKAKLALAAALAERLKQRGIHAQRHNMSANQAYREILTPAAGPLFTGSATVRHAADAGALDASLPDATMRPDAHVQ